MAEVAPENSSLPTLVPVQEDPQASEAPLPALNSRTTPNEQFYVRNHFSVPQIDLATWSLGVDGEVERPFSLSYAEMRAMPSSRLVATLECAGNSRTTIAPPIEGIPFGHGAVSTAEWEGVPLAAILERARIKNTAREVVLEGADFGEEEEEGLPVELSYARSLSVEKALDPSILLAYRMNGEDLPLAHGWPLRAIVPGWYGMASVKWLTHIRVLDHPFYGFFQSRRYINISVGTQPASGTPVTRMRVESVVVRPLVGEAISLGQYIIRGYAWSGQGEVANVGVSTDWGKTWNEAKLLDPLSSYAWTRWEFAWVVEKPGRTIVMARATDSQGNTQPLSPVWDYRGYGNNGSYGVPVEVSAV